MVDVTGEVAARAAVNRPLGIYSKEIFPIALFDFFVGDKRANILNDAPTFRDRFSGK